MQATVESTNLKPKLNSPRGRPSALRGTTSFMVSPPIVALPSELTGLPLTSIRMKSPSPRLPDIGFLVFSRNDTLVESWLTSIHSGALR